VERSELISLLSEPNVYFKFGNAEYYIFQKKFIEFKDNKVSYVSDLDLKYDTRYSFKSFIKSIPPGIPSLFENLGAPQEVKAYKDYLMIRYMNGALYFKGGELIKVAEKLYENESFSVNVSSIRDEDAPIEGKYFIVPGDPRVSIHDLQFKEIKSYLQSFMTSQGHKFNDDIRSCDFILYVKYGVSEPMVDIQTISKPIYVPTYVPGKSTDYYYNYEKIGTITTDGHFDTKYAGSVTTSVKDTNYLRFLNLEAIDNNIYKSERIIKPVWKVLITSTGGSNDLRYVLPALLTTASFHFNYDNIRAESFLTSPEMINQFIFSTNLYNMDLKRFIKGYSGNKLNALDKPQKGMNGCYSDADCSDGKTCATVKGEYPGSCAGKW